jgi:hypothetical protein
MPRRWLAAFLFAFKLLTLSGGFLFLSWYLLLPPNQSVGQTRVDMKWCLASEDFATVAANVSIMYFLASGLLIVGGVIQLFKCSRREAAWSLAFGIFALVVGIILACVSYPYGHYQILRAAAS